MIFTTCCADKPCICEMLEQHKLCAAQMWGHLYELVIKTRQGYCSQNLESDELSFTKSSQTQTSVVSNDKLGHGEKYVEKKIMVFYLWHANPYLWTHHWEEILEGLTEVVDMFSGWCGNSMTYNHTVSSIYITFCDFHRNGLLCRRRQACPTVISELQFDKKYFLFSETY